MVKVTISAGHGSKIRGMSDIIDEVDEARRVCSEVCNILFDAGVPFEGPYFDDMSTTQDENLKRICDWHNSHPCEIACSVHFNANQHTSKPVGTEVWYVTQGELAAEMATAIADAGELKDRGKKYTDGLYFLNHTEAPAILIEVCFGDSVADCSAYEANFRAICSAIAAVFAGGQSIEPPPPNEDLPVKFSGSCSWFGGPDDDGVSPSEGLAFLYSYDARKAANGPPLFLAQQPAGTTGLARRLNADQAYYVACRWDYDVTSKDFLADPDNVALVRANGREFLATPADWGPNENTGRAADISPALMAALGIDTDDDVEVIYPAPADQPQPEPEPEEATVNIQITSTGPVRITVNGTDIGEL